MRRLLLIAALILGMSPAHAQNNPILVTPDTEGADFFVSVYARMELNWTCAFIFEDHPVMDDERWSHMWFHGFTIIRLLQDSVAVFSEELTDEYPILRSYNQARTAALNYLTLDSSLGGFVSRSDFETGMLVGIFRANSDELRQADEIDAVYASMLETCSPVLFYE